MRMTIWEIDDETRLRYDHASDEVFMEQEVSISGRKTIMQIALAHEDLTSLKTALTELKVMLARPVTECAA